MPIMNNIYIIGHPCDLYRTQTFVKTVMDLYTEWNLSISYFTFTRCKQKNLLTNLCEFFIYIIDFIYSLFLIFRADYIYIPALILGSRRFQLQFFISIFLHKKIICEFYISYYDAFVLDRKTVRKDSRFAHQMLALDKKMHTCYRTIYLNWTEAERYSSLAGYKLRDLNPLIIPLSIKKRSTAVLPYYTNESNIFNICWWGTYIPLHGLDKIILAIAEIIKTDKNIHLYIMGNSEEASQKYHTIIKEKQLEEFIFLRNDYSFANGKLESFLITNCDLAMGAFGDSDKAKTVILNKCIEAIAMKIPVLTQRSKAFQEFFPNRSESIFYTENSISSLSESILKIKQMSQSEIKNHIEKGFEIYDSNFSDKNSSRLYINMLNNLE